MIRNLSLLGILCICAVDNLYSNAFTAHNRKKVAYIRIYNDDLKDGIDVFLQFKGTTGSINEQQAGYIESYDERESNNRKDDSVRVNGHCFEFELNKMNFPGMAHIYTTDFVSNGKVDLRFYIEEGDSVSIIVKDDKESVLGRNSNKYKCQYELNSIEKKFKFSLMPGRIDQVRGYFEHLDSFVLSSMAVLESYKKELTSNSYLLMKANIVTFSQNYKLSCTRRFREFDGAYREELYQCLDGYTFDFGNESISREFNKSSLVTNNPEYLEFIANEYEYDSCFKKRRQFDIKMFYNFVVSEFTGFAREWLIYNLIMKNLRKFRSEEIKFCIHHSLRNRYIKNKGIVDFFYDVLKTNIPGVPAYNFSLPDLNGNLVKLSQYRGKVVMLDFWYIGCGACAIIHPHLDSIKRLFDARDLIVISICLDFIGGKRSQWKDAVASGHFSSCDDINLFASKLDGHDPIIARHYYMNSCPSLILIDRTGALIEYPPLPFDIRSQNTFINILKKHIN